MMSGTPASFAAEITVGEFVQELARAKNLAGGDPGIAVGSLAAVGVRLPADLELSRPLTEGDAARIVSATGIRVRTSTPEAPFAAWQAELLLISLRPELGPGSDDPAPRTYHGSADGHHHKHKHKKPSTPTDPPDDHDDHDHQ